MNRPPALLWFAVLLLLLLPTAAGRVLLDLVGGLALVLLGSSVDWARLDRLESASVPHGELPACGIHSKVWRFVLPVEHPCLWIKVGPPPPIPLFPPVT